MGQQYSHLSSEERIRIEKLHCEQHPGIRRTAERIGRDKSTVSRELRRVCVQLVVAGLVTMIFRV